MVRYIYYTIYTMADQTISIRLREAFDQKRLTLRQVSTDTGIGYNTLQQIMSGKVNAMGVDKFASIWLAYPDLDGWHILTGQPAVNPCAEVEQKLSQVRSIVSG